MDNFHFFLLLQEYLLISLKIGTTLPYMVRKYLPHHGNRLVLPEELSSSDRKTGIATTSFIFPSFLSNN